MILEGCSLQGKMHKDYDVANQDYVLYEKAGNDVVGIVCDGVSLKSDRSFSDSEIASRFVAASIMKTLKEKLPECRNEHSMLVCLYDSLSIADEGLNQMLKKKGISLYDCQTTALAFVYRKGRIYAAMAGDGGIIYQTRDGEYGVLQTRVKTSSCVDPICDRGSWRFGKAGSAGNPVYRLLIATDGVFDSICRWDHDGMSLDAYVLKKMFEISKMKKNSRKDAFKTIIESIRSHDDKSAILMIDGKSVPDLHS